MGDIVTHYSTVDYLLIEKKNIVLASISEGL